MGLNKNKKNIFIWGELYIGESNTLFQYKELIKNEFENITLALNEKLISFFKNI